MGVLITDIESCKKVSNDGILFKSTYAFIRERGRDYYLLYRHSPTRLVDDFREWMHQRGRWTHFDDKRLSEHIAAHIEYAEELKPMLTYWRKTLGLNLKEIAIIMGRKWWYNSTSRNIFVRRFIYICQRLRPNG